MSILRPYNSKELMDEYKEAGLEFRHHDTQISAANRLMLPPLVIGLLVLYGEVDKFLGVEFKNPEAARLLIWSGCMIISLIWVFNVSRTAQLVHSHLDTRRKNAEIFGLRGHTKIFIMDQDSGFSKIFRHNKLRLVGFGIYFLLLLFKVESMNFHGVLSISNSIEGVIPWAIFLASIVIVSSCLPFSIYYLYFTAPLRSSRAAPTELRDTKKRKFKDAKKWEFQTNTVKWILNIMPIIIVSGLFIFSILLFVDLQQRPDANACLVRGLESFAKGEYDNSIKDFNQVIALEPNNAGAYFNRGSAYSKKREFANAIVDLDKAIALDPQNQSARDLRDEAHKELENQPNN